jgi:hypothetical protein
MRFFFGMMWLSGMLVWEIYGVDGMSMGLLITR